MPPDQPRFREKRKGFLIFPLRADCGSRKKSIRAARSGVALPLRRWRAPVRVPCASVFTRLAPGTFYEAVVFRSFYEIIILLMGLKMARPQKNFDFPFFFS
jgi:hypothetical protein